MKQNDITLHVTLAPDAAMALAHFLKSAAFNDYKSITGNEKGAYAMVSAAHALRTALVTQGYTQRVQDRKGAAL